MKLCNFKLRIWEAAVRLY